MKEVCSYPAGYFEQKVHFDFKNYAGILRMAHLLLLPANPITDIAIRTDVLGTGKGSPFYPYHPDPLTEAGC